MERFVFIQRFVHPLINFKNSLELEQITCSANNHQTRNFILIGYSLHFTNLTAFYNAFDLLDFTAKLNIFHSKIIAC